MNMADDTHQRAEEQPERKALPPAPAFDEGGLEHVKIPASRFTIAERHLIDRRKALLVRLGWNVEIAAMAATLFEDYDLDQAVYLHEKGCPPHLAMLILSPFDRVEVRVPRAHQFSTPGYPL